MTGKEKKLIRECMKKLPIHVEKFRQIKKNPTRIYLICGNDGKFLLRVGKIIPFYKRWVGSHGFVTHLAVCKSLKKHPDPNLNIPELVDYQGWKYMLIRYIEDAHAIYPRNDDEVRSVINTLLTFQTCKIKINRPLFHKLMGAVIAWRKNISTRSAVNLIKLVHAWGAKNVFRGFKVLKTIRRMKKPFWIHRDFNSNNTLIGDNNKVYLLDFESVNRQRRGLMVDAVDFALDLNEITFDENFLAVYIELASAKFKGESIDFANELRAAVLRRLLNIRLSRSNPPEIKAKAEDWVLNTILPDKQFNAWYEQITEKRKTVGSQKQHINSERE